MSKRKTKHLFSKIAIIYCIAFSSIASIWALWIADKDGLLVTEVLAIILALFGGELLLICLRQVIGTKECKKMKGEEENV